MTTPETALTPPEPAAPVRWGFWGTSLLGLLIGIAFVFVQTVAYVVGVVAQGAGLTAEEMTAALEAAATDGTLVASAMLPATLVCLAMIAGAVKLRRGAVLTDYLALRPVPWVTLLKWAGLLAVLIVLADLTTAATGRPIVPPFMSEVYASAQPVWLLWLALIVAAPLVEETFFRGFLLPGFAGSFLKPPGAVIVTAVLWAGFHLQYDAFGIAIVFLFGLVFGAARVRTGSLWVPMALHALVNLVATIQAAVLG